MNFEKEQALRNWLETGNNLDTMTVADVFRFAFAPSWVNRKLKDFCDKVKCNHTDKLSDNDRIWSELAKYHLNTTKALNIIAIATRDKQASQLLETAAQETLQASVQVTDIEDHDDAEWFTKPVERKAVEGEMCVYGLNGRDAYALSAPVTSDSKDYPVQRIDKERVIINGKEYIDSHFVWQGVRIYTPVCQDIVEDMGELPDIAPQMPQAAREYASVMCMTYAEAFPDADTVAEEGIYLPNLEELGLTTTLEAGDDYSTVTDILHIPTELIATSDHYLLVAADWISAGGTIAIVDGKPYHLNEEDDLFYPLVSQN